MHTVNDENVCTAIVTTNIHQVHMILCERHNRLILGNIEIWRWHVVPFHSLGRSGRLFTHVGEK